MKIDREQAERINAVTAGSPFWVKKGQDVDIHIPYNPIKPVELIIRGKKTRRGELDSTSSAQRISNILFQAEVSSLLEDPNG